VRTQLLDIMQQHKVPIVSAGTDWDTVRKVRRCSTQSQTGLVCAWVVRVEACWPLHAASPCNAGTTSLPRCAAKQPLPLLSHTAAGHLLRLLP